MDLTQIISQYGSNGIFFALFLYLFLQSNKDSRDRELAYKEVVYKNQEVIERFAISYESISKDVCELKQDLKAVAAKQ